MKHLIKILITTIFVIATTHAIMYKQWWAFGILTPIAITAEWDRRIRTRKENKQLTYKKGYKNAGTT